MPFGKLYSVSSAQDRVPDSEPDQAPQHSARNRVVRYIRVPVPGKPRIVVQEEPVEVKMTLAV